LGGGQRCFDHAGIHQTGTSPAAAAAYLFPAGDKAFSIGKGVASAHYCCVLQVNSTIQSIAPHAEIAARYGKPLITYEAGPGMAGNTEFTVAVSAQQLVA